MFEPSVIGGHARRGIGELPWAGTTVHTPETFTERVVGDVTARIAEAAVSAGASTVLAPTHFLRTLPSPWVEVDERLTLGLRHELDIAGGRHVAIYYPVIIDLKSVGTGAVMLYLLRHLAHLVQQGAIDALTIRAHGFGVARSGPPVLHQFVDLARSFHPLRLPIMAEQTGTVGLGLLAFGAVGAIESGLTFGETCDLSSLLKPTKGKGFMPAPRVYLQQIGAFVKKGVATEFLRKGPLKHWHVCQDECCRGVSGMLEDPRRHFVHQWAKEVADLANAPPDIRADLYLTKLSRAVELASKAAEAQPILRAHAGRLVKWQRGFSEQRVNDRYARTLSPALTPTGRRRTRTPIAPTSGQDTSDILSIQSYLTEQQP
jgi:hypothetical protein